MRVAERVSCLLHRRSSVPVGEVIRKSPLVFRLQSLFTSRSRTNIPESTVQDESLKRLLMSWYYAGYYTGIYEGQQNIKTSNETLHEYRPHPSLDLHEPIDHRMGDAS